MARRRWGYTLIEMSAVTAVLFLAASLVLPELVGMRRASRLATLEAALARAPLQAVHTARMLGASMRVRLEASALVIEPKEGGAGAATATVGLEGLLEVHSARLEGQTVDTSAWEWTAYGDGTAPAASISFRTGTAIRTLVIERTGAATWIRGLPDDTQQDEWDAGDIEHRS